MDSENDENPKSYKRIKLWSADDTQVLLDLCGGYLFQIGPMKKFKNKKEMWAKISTKIPDKSAKQCEERFKTVLRRKKKKNYIHNTGKKTKQTNAGALEPEVQFSIENNENTALEPEVQLSIENMTLEPEVQLSFENNEEENNECSMTTTTVQETLWEIALKNEAANERRHKEQMKAMEKMTSLLQKILEETGKKII